MLKWLDTIRRRSVDVALCLCGGPGSRRLHLRRQKPAKHKAERVGHGEPPAHTVLDCTALYCTQAERVGHGEPLRRILLSASDTQAERVGRGEPLRHCTVPYYTVLRCTVLCCAVLYRAGMRSRTSSSRLWWYRSAPKF
eukprot:1194648-Prorocentrum_minimum.AAC.3